MSQREILTVSEFVSSIKSVVNDEPQFKNVAIVGELSNFTAHSSGHFYFSLKDDKASIRAIMFRSNSISVKFIPKNGDKVVLIGHLDVYEQSGQIQFYARQMNLDGLGDLYLEFERIKKDLFEKGYFDEQHKKALPKFPQRIGVISGKGSAAHSDITRTLYERWPLAQHIDFFSLVQGNSAIDDLSRNIQKADALGLDVIILARGGGSIEDLWAFNDVKVVMAVFNASTPIISGVGHENDTTLVDYVSDYRAATPTAAAVSATPHIEDINKEIRDYKNRMYKATVTSLNTQKRSLESILNTRIFVQPLSLLDNDFMKLDLLNSKLLSQTKLFHDTQKYLHGLEVTMQQNLNYKLKVTSQTLLKTKDNVYKDIKTIIKSKNEQLTSVQNPLNNKLIKHIDNKKQLFANVLMSMKHLSPFEVMGRGYSVVSKNDEVVKSVDQISLNDVLTIKLKNGSVKTKVIEREELNYE